MKTKPSIAKIINTTAQFYQISPKKLQKRSRKAKFVKPRQVAMYLLREELNRSFPYIGRLFGSKDHTTVIYAYNKIKNTIEESPGLRSELEQIKNTLHNQTTNKALDNKNEPNSEEKKSKNMNNQNPTDKRERFKRLATYRTNEILKRLKILGNCSNRSAYDYTEEEINKIFSEIERKIKKVKAKFYFPKEKKFKL